MAEPATAPPVLSTPETHVLNDTTDIDILTHQEKLSNEQLEIRYEITRTIKEIKANRWRRIALQFPDEMLPHSARVYQSLQKGLKRSPSQPRAKASLEGSISPPDPAEQATDRLASLSVEEDAAPVKLTILADTSYGSCCVDEIAAEHVDADAIVHYGRACLSPTARLPVLHIYTQRELDYEKAVETFRTNFPDKHAKIIVTADMPYSQHVQPLCSKLLEAGYQSMFAASIIHDPSSPIPNRTVPPEVVEDPTTQSNWHLFHISEPPTALLLTLSSRMASITVFLTTSPSNFSTSSKATAMVLRRRYALITSLTTTPIWGILINTLSVRNYLSMITHVQSLISSAGKKSYLFVVGKINAAKVANFSEIGGWVVIGCWESSLIDSKEFYRPIITPFELELALKPDSSRLWSGEWRADFEGVLRARKRTEDASLEHNGDYGADYEVDNGDDGADGRNALDGNASDEDSDEPPEFDLRTGRYVSKSRPMTKTRRLNDTYHIKDGSAAGGSTALTKRAKGDMVQLNGIASPAADFLANKRTWRGLGSDFEINYEDKEREVEGSLIEEGQTGVAGGYTVGESWRA